MIMDAIARSGLSQTQIRERLTAAGYDASLADPFFGNAQRGAAEASTAQFGEALSRLGLLGATNTELSDDESDGVKRENTRLSTGRADEVFGRSFFQNVGTSFDPSTSGPVDPGYRLGAGDRLQFVTTGAVEVAYALEVQRDGTVIVPVVGQVSVAGLTLDAARSLLRQRSARVYAALTINEASLDVTLLRFRSNQVFVIGEVERPGAYQVSALGTAFHALARAGGPTVRGSFRSVVLRRGGAVLRTIDLYHYLVDGDASDDVRLEHGDVLFVPPANRLVRLDGAVRRPGRFELLDGERFSSLLKFAGGALAVAAPARVQLDRVLTAEERTPGRERVVIDLRTNGILASIDTMVLRDDDAFAIPRIGDLRRNTITLTGSVYQPGQYEWSRGLTVRQLVGRADGLRPWAQRDRITVRRRNLVSNELVTLTVDLTSDSADASLEEYDEVTVFDGRALSWRSVINVTGAVGRPTQLEWGSPMTLQNALDFAGGLRRDAQRVDVVRRGTSPLKRDTLSLTLSVTLSGEPFIPPSIGALPLNRDDEIYVRTAPWLRAPRRVRLTGEFEYSGIYVLSSEGERLSELMRRAGRLSFTADTSSFQVRRAGSSLTVDLRRALDGRRPDDIVLEDGDQLVVSRTREVVAVQGAVLREGLTLARRNEKLKSFLQQAGGMMPTADRSRVVVEAPSGKRTVHRLTWRSWDNPIVQPGSVIIVPFKPEGRASDRLSTSLQVVSAFTSLIIAAAVALR
jgi:protein involved in polysaccharide export with SLBB domain